MLFKAFIVSLGRSPSNGASISISFLMGSWLGIPVVSPIFASNVLKVLSFMFHVHVLNIENLRSNFFLFFYLFFLQLFSNFVAFLSRFLSCQAFCEHNPGRPSQENF